MSLEVLGRFIMYCYNIVIIDLAELAGRHQHKQETADAQIPLGTDKETEISTQTQARQ